MKRDMDLVRELLYVIENADSNRPAVRTNLNVWDPRVQYHLRLLFEAGFVRGVGQTVDGAVSLRLTWQGHEFLEIARNGVLWDHAKRYVAERTSGVSASLLQAVLNRWGHHAVDGSARWPSYDERPTPYLTIQPTAEAAPPIRRETEDRRFVLREPAKPHPADHRNYDRYTSPNNSHFQFHVWNNGAPYENAPLHLI